MPSGVGDEVGRWLLIALAVWLGWRLRRRWRRSPRRKPAADDSDGAPYRIYTTDFDRTVAARDAPALLAAEDRRAGVAPPRGVDSWEERRDASERFTSTHASELDDAASRLEPSLARAGGDLAVMVLVDHSGSMRDDMPGVAATVRWLSVLFDRHRAGLAIAGFTTLGWRGGAVRRQWLAARRPDRPGRLCALLHLIYRDFDAPLDPEDMRTMPHPVILRENVDGEAIEWAVARLAVRPERNKLLVVISDGAPVDDSTLMENGPAFLERHFRKIIDEVRSAGIVSLGAVGINHRVDRYYDRSIWVEDLSVLPSALADIIDLLLGEMENAQAN